MNKIGEEYFKNKGILVITATSAGYDAGNETKITINEEIVKLEPNSNGHFRGLHVIVVNPNDGNIEYAQVFDTYKSSDSLQEFINSNWW